ncbi:CBN-LGC-18 protein [Caenorhabditis brenneri]|uniref:CBN-LGC-18 protein n=1 Tax=Caenorhabditis brenneri TaxID=135651 RepID=G0MHC4_CAEBE|nr:CBN-LGC-18 protein [Caenorhabditis brenneri]
MKSSSLVVFYSLCNIVWSYYVNDSYYVDVTKPIGYNPAAPKRYNYTVSLYYLKLVEVIEPEEKVSVVLEMAEYWYDPRLAWDSSKYGDIQMLHMRQDRGNAEWDLVNLTHRVELLSYDDGTGDMQLATFEIKIRRNPLYYIYMIVFPSFIINALSIIGVFMRDSDKMSRLNVGLTNIMTMTFILGVMADKIPKTGSIPLLGIYIIINLFIMILAVGLTNALNELRKCLIPRLRLKKTNLNQKLEYILGDPLETICMAFLEIVNAVNFGVMIGFWINDS